MKNEVTEELVEFVFRITLKRDPISFKSDLITSLVYLESMAKKYKSEHLTVVVLKDLVIQRLSKKDRGKMIICSNKETEPDSEVKERRDIYYLYNCYQNLLAMKVEGKKPFYYKKIKHLIIKLSSKATFKEGDRYMLLPFLEDNFEQPDKLIPFLTDITNYLKNNWHGTITSFIPVFKKLLNEFTTATPLEIPVVSLSILKIFSKVPSLVLAMIKYSSPKIHDDDENAYGKTLLGSLLSLSFPTRSQVTRLEHSSTDDNADDNADDTEYHYKFVKNNLWIGADHLSAKVGEIFFTFLKTKSTRATTLSWIGKLLDYYESRDMNIGTTKINFPRISFCLNLCAILLRIFVSLFSGTRDRILLKIDPTYCAKKAGMKTTKGSDANDRYMKKFNSMHNIISTPKCDERPFSEGNFSLITECFYMTHRSFEIATRFVYLFGELNELFRLVNTKYSMESENQVNAAGVVARYRSMRESLYQPSSATLAVKFISATSAWLIQVVMDPRKCERLNYCPVSFRQVKFPLKRLPVTLRSIPRMLLRNISTFCNLFKNADLQGLEGFSREIFEPIMTTLTIFIGSSDIVDSLRLRVQLLKSLASLKSFSINQDEYIINFFAFDIMKRRIFDRFPHRQELVTSLLRILIDIEERRNRVDIDDRFDYKLTIYNILEYLWSFTGFRLAMRNIAKLSEGYTGRQSPPLFLKFVFIVINDNVFLLDESLTASSWVPRGDSRLHQLDLDELEHELELVMELGLEFEYNWRSEQDELSDEDDEDEQSEQDEQSDSDSSVESYPTPNNDSVVSSDENLNSRFLMDSEEALQILRVLEMRILQTGYIINKKTIITLKNLTGEITEVFCQKILVEKLTAMLNHMLSYLLKQMKKFPRLDSLTPLQGVCLIYINLGDSDDFCRAVAKDGRSYKRAIFRKAIRLLPKELGSKLRIIARKVEKMAKIQKLMDEILSDAPDEFLDPITSEIFMDPVKLPSRVTIDRTTIVRHLLTNGKTDPFSRSYLTVEMLRPDIEMKDKITAWIISKMP